MVVDLSGVAHDERLAAGRPPLACSQVASSVLSAARAASSGVWSAPADPVDVRPGGEEQGGDVLVAAAAGRPERRGYPFGVGAGLGCQLCLHAVGEAEGGGLVDIRAGAALDEAEPDPDTAEHRRVGDGAQPADDRPGASMWAPASRRASANSMSSLLAAQCSGVSSRPSGSFTGASRSAPASTSTVTISRGLRRWPGQSAKRWRSVRDPAHSPSFTIRARARPGCLSMRRRRRSAWPRCTAAVTSTASGWFQRKIMSRVVVSVIACAFLVVRMVLIGSACTGLLAPTNVVADRTLDRFPLLRNASVSLGGFLSAWLVLSYPGAGYPARAGGPWLRSTCRCGDFASVVPSGCKISDQPHW
jgi:hypothetical protein